MDSRKKKRLPFRPKAHAEDYILTWILTGKYPPGSALPGERALSEEIGVTRPTLREVLHRLSGEGWLSICHGKPTIVNDFWKKGGLGLLNTMARYGSLMPNGMISHLLGLRATIMPTIAFQAADRLPETLLDFLTKAGTLKDTAKSFTRFDWGLHKVFAEASGNPLALMLLNSFDSLFHEMGRIYFDSPQGKNASRRYYQKLTPAIKEGPQAVETLVREALIEARDIWLEIKA